jgi:hypothetical protein
MNIKIETESLERMKRCVVGMGNKMNCHESTGIHYVTIDRILERGYAKQEQIDKLLSYCDKVEGITSDKAA